MNGAARRTVFVLYLGAAAAALWTVLATRFGGQTELLARMTEEGGPFETATAMTLALLGVWCALRGSWRWRLFGLLLIVAACEEMSWGQHLLGYETPSWLEDANYQGEANLHNLVDSEIFSALVLVPIHLAFVYVPLLLALWPRLAGVRVAAAVPDELWPLPQTTLIFCFGWGLHAWGEPAATADSAALVIALAFAGVACWRVRAWRRPAVIAHWALACAATVAFAASVGVYRYYNMQYEIRELFVALGLAHWLTGGTDRARVVARAEG